MSVAATIGCSLPHRPNLPGRLQDPKACRRLCIASRRCVLELSPCSCCWVSLSLPDKLGRISRHAVPSTVPYRRPESNHLCTQKSSCLSTAAFPSANSALLGTWRSRGAATSYVPQPGEGRNWTGRASVVLCFRNDELGKP